MKDAESLQIPIFTKISNFIGTRKNMLSKGGAVTIYYSDFSADENESHRIAGKQSKQLITAPLVQITRENFQASNFWIEF
jgi:hypothetical protein